MTLPATTFWHIALVSTPALLVLITAYLLIKQMVKNDQDRREMEMRIKSIELATPIRLQAYERLTLLLERISIENLITSNLSQGKTAATFHSELTLQIRTEYEHNLSQQIYVSATVWQHIRDAREKTIVLINEAAKSTPPNIEGTALGARIYELFLEEEEAPNFKALKELKKEVRKIY